MSMIELKPNVAKLMRNFILSGTRRKRGGYRPNRPIHRVLVFNNSGTRELFASDGFALLHVPNFDVNTPNGLYRLEKGQLVFDKEETDRCSLPDADQVYQDVLLLRLTRPKLLLQAEHRHTNETTIFQDACQMIGAHLDYVLYTSILKSMAAFDSNWLLYHNGGEGSSIAFTSVKRKIVWVSKGFPFTSPFTVVLSQYRPSIADIERLNNGHDNQ